MLKKLMRYDLQWIINKVLSYYAAATLLTAVFARVFHTFAQQATIWLILDKFFTGAFISCAIAIQINALMRSLVCFRRTLYGDPSYLTHTLPIKRSAVFDAKTLSGVVSLVFTLLSAALGIGIVELTQREKWEMLLEMLRAPGAKSTLLLICAILVLELLTLYLAAVFGFVLGHRRERGRIPFSILFSAGVYMLGSGVILGLLFAFSFLKPELHALFTQVVSTEELFSLPSMRLMLAVTCILYLLADVGLYFAARRLFCKGVNVE